MRKMLWPLQKRKRMIKSWHARNRRVLRRRAAAEKVNRDIQSAKDTATRSWSAVRAKISADINHLKADVAEKKHDLDVKMAEKKADELEWEANVAIDYAIASVEQAGWAALDAVAARVQAQQAKAS
jgi:hypothetical protein